MKKHIAILLALLIFIMQGTSVFAAETVEATSMRLEKTEGTVTLKNQSGTKLPARSNSKLYDGYSLTTTLASYAYLGLDDKKAVKLDEVSSATVKKSGKKLELFVEKGQVLFNIKEPLKADETMEIRTSNMVTGIRGTSGVVKRIDANTTEFYLLDGEVSTTYLDSATKESKTIKTKAGELTSITHSLQSNRTDNKRTAATQTRKLSENDISGFAAVEIAKDPELQKKIEGQTDLNVKMIVETSEDKLKQEQTKTKKAKEAVDKKRADQEKTNSERDSSKDPKPTNPKPYPTPDPIQDPNLDQDLDQDLDDNSKEKYKVTFDVDGGTPVHSQKIVSGKKARRPLNPIKLGFQFDDWYTSPEYTTIFDFDTPITSDTTIYAKWIANSIILSEENENLTMDDLEEALEGDTENIILEIESDTFTITDEDLTIPSDKTLIVASGTLEIDSESTFTNEGTMIIDGDLVNKGTFENSGNITAGEDKTGNSLIENNGEFSIDGGTISSSTPITIRSSGSQSVLNISGDGSIVNTSSARSHDDSLQGAVVSNSTINMSGGEISSDGIGVLCENDNSSFALSAGSVHGSTGIKTLGNCIISGGDISGDIAIDNKNNLTISGGTIVGESYGIRMKNADSGTITITGSKITGDQVGVYFEHNGNSSLSIGGGIIECNETEDNCFALMSKNGELNGVSFTGGVLRAHRANSITNIISLSSIQGVDDGWHTLTPVTSLSSTQGEDDAWHATIPVIGLSSIQG